MGGFVLMYHLVHVEINICFFSGAGTDACRNASLQQSEVPELAEKKEKKKKKSHITKEKSKGSFCSVARF